MTSFEYLHPTSRSRLLRAGDARRIADGVRQGGLAVLPTETGYMLAAVVMSVSAVEAAFRVKGRDPRNTMHIACSSLSMAAEFSEVDKRAERILGAFTPGPVSVVVRQNARLPTDLITVNGTVGIRIPDHPATLQVIAEVGLPVTATSVNTSGEAPAGVGRDYLEQLIWPDLGPISVVEDDAAIVFDRPSTLVRTTGPDLEVLRPGPVTESDILRVAGIDS